MKHWLAPLFLFCVSCNIYTVNNLTDEDIKAGALLVKSNECIEFVDFFGLIGDFPLVFLNSKGDKIDEISYKPAHYKVQPSPYDPKMGDNSPLDIEVVAVKESCKTTPE